MATLINHYSFLLLALGSTLGLAAFLARDGLNRRDGLAVGALAAGYAAAFLLLGSGVETPGATDRLQAVIGSGRPVLVEIYSPYCLGCMAARPIVDQITAEHLGRLDHLRVNRLNPAGRQFADQTGLVYTPAFLLYAADGTEILRAIGAIDPRDVRRALAGP
jgi:thiol-disulfide isomerase/thioredoxin